MAAAIAPTADSDIRVEVWLPVSGWNGKFQGVGNGGWAGSISYPAMGRAVEAGYATASTDTGHTGAGASFAMDNEKLIDYAYRSEHEMTVKAKAIIDAFYGSAAEALVLQRLLDGRPAGADGGPALSDDYDGIIAGAAANPKTHLDSWRIWMAQAMHKDPASTIPAAKYPVIHEAVLKACDALDGVKDRPHRGSDEMSLRSERPRVQERRRTGVSDRPAGEGCAGRDEPCEASAYR